jgi:pyruvate/2-oxoglutarate dehydrogenase complex dihydrolipoamide dehydrogenase (E3) component
VIATAGCIPTTTRVHNARHRRDVRKHSPDKGINHLKHRDVYQNAARARAFEFCQNVLLKQHHGLIVHIDLNGIEQHAANFENRYAHSIHKIYSSFGARVHRVSRASGEKLWIKIHFAG